MRSKRTEAHSHNPHSKYPHRYKGYWIDRNPLNGNFWIEKEGAHVGSCKGLEDGKRVIDQLVD